MLPKQDRTSEGVSSFFNSMAAIAQQKVQNEQQKQQLLTNLLKVSLKDVKGRYAQQAIELKKEAMQKAQNVLADVEGMPGAQEMLQIQQAQDDLESFIGRYQGLEKWYFDAAQSAAQIKDDDARAKTIKNIADIMQSPDLDTAWNKVMKADWFVHPVEDVDPSLIRQRIIAHADAVDLPDNVSEKDQYGNVIYKSWQGKDPEQIRQGAAMYWQRYGESLKKKHNIKSLDEWMEFVGTGKTVSETIRSGDGTTTQDKRAKVLFNEAIGGWDVSHVNNGKGVQIDSFKTPQGTKKSKYIKDATITRVYFNDKGVLKADVTFDKVLELNFDELRKEFGDAYVKSLVQDNPSLLTKTQKDPINKDVLTVDYYYVQDAVESQTKLMPAQSAGATGDPLNLFGEEEEK